MDTLIFFCPKKSENRERNMNYMRTDINRCRMHI